MNKRELTNEELKLLETEGYKFIDYFHDDKRKENLLKIQHKLCGKVYNVRPNNFFKNGQRCTCSRKKKFSAVNDNITFQNKLDELYGKNEYILKSNYINRNSPVCISHSCGFEYTISRAEYLLDKKEKSGRCPVCSKGNSLSIDAINEKFKRLNLNIKIDDSEIFIPGKVKYNIYDLNCNHVYLKNYRDILKNKKCKCPICSNKYSKTLTIEDVKKEIESIDKEYTVISKKYTGTHDPLLVQHNKCKNIYKVSRTNFLAGKRCPFCSNGKGFSKDEIEVLEFVKQYFPNAKKLVEYDKINKKKYEIDIFIPELKIGIEYNGLYYHAEHMDINDPMHKENFNKNKHLDKTLFFKTKGIRIIQIFSDEWENKKEIVKDKLKSILGIQKEKIYARDCSFKEINSIDRNHFLNENHIQGADRASISYGLFYNEKLVAVMSLTKLRKALGQNSKDGYFELSRYAGLKNTTIVGGFSKLLKNILRLYPEIKNIITYADLRWTAFDNNVYNENNFILDHISEPSYYYIPSNYKKREYRFKFRKSELKKLFPDIYEDKKSEKEIMTETGYDRIWDCGNLVYSYKV